MYLSNIRIALQSIRNTRGRSFLTTLGIVIGVAAVVLAINIGQGVQRQVNSQIDAAGGSLVTVRSGRVVVRDDEGKVLGYSLNQALGTATLTNEDLRAISETPNVANLTPLAEVSVAASSSEGVQLVDGHVIGVLPSAPTLLGKSVVFGSIFTDTENSSAAVIGSGVAEELFGDPSPIGRSLILNEDRFIVRGVFEDFATSPLTLGTNLNRTIFIPYSSASRFSEDSLRIREILVRADTPEDVDGVIADIDARVSALHGQEDFSVLRRSDLDFITNDIFDLLTAVVAAAAAISLVVGGIGIMNIMLVSVAERTREIGIRKAVGASNIHIMAQFLTESIVLSVLGGIIGVSVAQIVGLVLRSTTSLKPVFDLQVVLVTIGLSAGVGILFGVGPAWKAARKKPIESLRS